MGEKKLLIFHQGALGDFVLAFPALIRLKQHFSQTDAICKPQLGELAKGFRLVDKWFSQDAARFASLFSGAIDPDVKSLFEAYDEIILFSFSEQLEKAINEIKKHSVCRIPPRPKSSDKTHVGLHLLKSLSGCGLIGEDDEPGSLKRPSLYNPTEVFYETPHSQRILLHPGAGSSRKMWALSNFLKLEVSLKADTYRPEFVIGPAEEFLGKELLDDNGGKRTIRITDDLSALVALMQSADGFIGNDSGVSHLAAFLGLPTVAVFGPSDPEIWRPVGPAVSVLSPQKLECDPKIGTFGPFKNNKEDFNTISSQMVLDTLYNLMRL
jgi:ADP-heptose:LPS heptosyltransferase